jgi:hypothetical protein
MGLLWGFLLMPLGVAAGINDYQCIVIGEAFLSGNGTIGPYPKPVYVNQKFALDRASGVITGGPFFSSNLETGIRSILDPGGREWSYKAFSTHPLTPSGNRNVDYIVVEEFEKGRTKPFVALVGGSTIVHGLCE